MYKQSEFGNSAAIKHQRLVQRDALIIFQNLFPFHKLKDCGLYIDKDIPFICASPFKLYGRNHILMIKCPLKQYRKQFEKAIAELPFWKEEDGCMAINKESAWFIELQSELHITGKSHGFIMVWLGEYKGQPQYRIYEFARDNIFETELKPEITYFYNEVMLKELVDPRKDRSMKLREYDAKKDLYI